MCILINTVYGIVYHISVLFPLIFLHFLERVNNTVHLNATCDITILTAKRNFLMSECELKKRIERNEKDTVFGKNSG